MKKLSLLLALLMILSSGVLCACDSKKSSDDEDDTEDGSASYSGAEKVVVDALEAVYKDGDAEKFIEKSFTYNLELLETIFPAELYDEIEYEIREEIKELEEEIPEEAADIANEDDEGKTKATIETTYCHKYDNTSDAYNNVISRFGSQYTASLEEVVEEVAVVGVLVMFEYTDDGDKKVDAETEKHYCLKIDGKWYML